MNTARPAHRAYAAHLNVCPAAEHGRWCQVCLDLVREADAESWRRATTPNRQAA